MDILNIVNEDGCVVGKATRGQIHKKGLLHKEVHVWLYTPSGEVIFQHRGKNKDTHPNLLDASVGGHVESGDSDVEAAIRELKEETGIVAGKRYLKLEKIIRSKSHDKVTGMINNVIRSVYTYGYKEPLDSLKIEKGKSLGFEAWSIDKVLNISKKDRDLFVPTIFNKEILEIFRKIKKSLIL